MGWLVFIGWVISYANEWEDYSIYFGERWRFSGVGPCPLLGLVNCHGASGCVISFADWGSRSSLVCHLGPIWPPAPTTTRDFLLIGWWWGNGMVLGNLTLSLKLPSSSWVGALVPAELKRYCYAYFLRRNRDPTPRLHYPFLTTPPFVFASSPFPDYPQFEPALWNSRRVKEAEIYPPPPPTIRNKP